MSALDALPPQSTAGCLDDKDLTVIIELALATMLGAAEPTADCHYDRAAMLALAPGAFDQDLRGGWRPLADKPACRSAAAALLTDYRTANWQSLDENELHTNYWHEGQMRALVGDVGRAAPLLLAGVNPADKTDYADYAIGTVAFLHRDLNALKAARERMSRLPEPDWYAAAKEQARTTLGHVPHWPPNAEVLDGLINCFEKSYEEAYKTSCRPSVTEPSRSN